MATTTASARRAKPDAVGLTRGEATRKRIETEALSLFERQGFRTTTMREITSACGVTPAAFYNHFDSKDELLLSIVLTTFADLESEVLSTARSASGSNLAELAATVRAMTLWHCKNLHRAKVSNRESLELPNQLLDQVRERRRTLRKAVEKTITNGLRDGEFVIAGPSSTASRLAASAILGIVQSIPGWYIESGVWEPAQIADHIVELVMAMVGAKR